jgi:hypothetical protein
MGKTKKRGGAKAHRKRVQARNNMIKGVRNQMQKMWETEMMAQLEKMREQSQESQPVDIEVPQVQLPNDDENTPLEIKL